MKTLQKKAAWLFEKMAFVYQPIGLMMADKKPEGAVSLKKKGSGCIASLIFLAAKGKTVAIDKDSTSYPKGSGVRSFIMILLQNPLLLPKNELSEVRCHMAYTRAERAQGRRFMIDFDGFPKRVFFA